MARKRSTKKVAEEKVVEATEEVVETPVESVEEEVTEAPVETVKEAKAVKKAPKQKKEVISGVTEKQAEVAAMLDQKAIEDLLKQSGVSVEDKLKTISEKAIPTFKQLAAKLIAYNEAMGTGIIDPNLGVGKQLDLANTLKSAVETKDASEFKIKMDIINLTFMAYSNSGFNVYKIFRFDDKWKWNKKDLTTLQNLAMIISTLASLSDRKKNIKKIDLDKALDKDEITLSEDAINNIKSYYKA